MFIEKNVEKTHFPLFPQPFQIHQQEFLDANSLSANYKCHFW